MEILTDVILRNLDFYRRFSVINPIAYILSSNFVTEPPHDKINKMTKHPAKTQISLGIRPVWS